jgi:hypothetical protein
MKIPTTAPTIIATQQIVITVIQEATIVLEGQDLHQIPILAEPLLEAEAQRVVLQEVVHQEEDNMEKNSLFFGMLFAFLTGSFMYGQNLHEVVRYGTETLNGTARYQSLGGAFGALGGDLSAISNNPAGSTVFAFSEAGLTADIQSFKNDAVFFGNQESDQKSTFNIGQVGFVLVLKNPSVSNWDKLAFGFNTQMVNNFNNKVYFEGTNTNRGLQTYFLAHANGVSYDFDLGDTRNISNEYVFQGNRGYSAQQTYLALRSHLMNYDKDNNEYYVPGVFNENKGIDQTHLVYSTGGQRLYSLNFAGRYNEKLSIGANLNFYSIDYSETKETFDYYLDQENSFIKEVLFQEELRTFGTGVSIQIGAIYQASKAFRLGFSYTSPTFYALEDEQMQALSVKSQDDLDGEVYTEQIKPDVVNLIGPYYIRTPSKTQASAALVVGTSGFISADIGIKNYANANVSDEAGTGFGYLNNRIVNDLASSTFMRVGGEKRFGDVSLRAGYWKEQSPYKNTTIKEDFTGYSLGLGIRFGGSALDFSFSASDQKYKQQMYSLGLTDVADINQRGEQIALTYSFRF